MSTIRQCNMKDHLQKEFGDKVEEFPNERYQPATG